MTLLYTCAPGTYEEAVRSIPAETELDVAALRVVLAVDKAGCAVPFDAHHAMMAGRLHDAAWIMLMQLRGGNPTRKIVAESLVDYALLRGPVKVGWQHV